jgi:uncharacterized iron-regulated membrane protein
MPVPEHTLDPSPSPSPSTETASAFATQRWRAFVVRLHFYAGVLVGPFLIVAAITGGLYALAPSLEQFVYRNLLTVEPAGVAAPLRNQVAAAQSAFPDLSVVGVRPAAHADESTRIYFTDPSLGADLLRAVFVDPYSTRLLGDEPTWLGYLPLSTWLDGLHRHLNLGEPGRIYSEIAASWLWVVALGGLYLWLVKAASDRRRGRRARILRVDRTVAGRSRTLNWHGAVGVWLLAGLLFLSATGITWSTYAGAHVSDIRSAFDWQRPQLNTSVGGEHAGHDGHGEPSATQALDTAAIDYDAVLEAAAGAQVRLPVEIALPAEPGHGLTVTEIDKPYRMTTNAATVDPTHLTVTDAVDFARDYSVIAKLADWGIRAHMGVLFGLLNQVLLLGIAAALLTVMLRGYRMWWQRRPTRGSSWAVGRAPVRGGLRRLPPVVIAGIVTVAVAVGWFLPLLGVTLAAFVAVDLFIGAVKKPKSGTSGGG